MANGLAEAAGLGPRERLTREQSELPDYALVPFVCEKLVTLFLIGNDIVGERKEVAGSRAGRTVQKPFQMID